MRSSEVARTTLGTMGKIADRLFIEGSPEQIRERIEQLVRERRIQAARWCKTWREYEIDELTPRSKGRFYMTPDGDLLTPARGQVFAQHQAADGSPTVTVFDEHAATAFAVTDTGGIITFEKAPMSATQLDFVERRRADKLAGAQAEQREQAQQVRSWRSKQPTRAVTLADLEQRDMPTVSAAAELLHDLGCKLGTRDGTIVVEAPERLAPSEQEHDDLHARFRDAVRVLVAARSVVVPALESSSRKPLAERLPDKHIGVDGGIVS